MSTTTTEALADKHTPAPWRACEGNYKKRDGLTLCTCGQIWSTAADKQVATIQRAERATDIMAEACYVEDNHEAEANAYLIAAAPELLEALEKAVYAFDLGTFLMPHENKVIAQAKAALSKARGQHDDR